MNFNDYEWHDAILKNIVIDRSDPGNNDTITMDVIWPDETLAKIVFIGVYKAVLDLNFGAIGKDFIYEAIVTTNDADLIDFQNEWQQFKIPKLCCYIFKTTALGSNIKLFAESFKIMSL